MRKPRIYEHRKAKNISQARLAEASGISRQAVIAIESGASVPSYETALSISQALGVKMEDLYDLGKDTLAVADATLKAVFPIPATLSARPET